MNPPPYRFSSVGIGISTIICRELGYSRSMFTAAQLDKIFAINMTKTGSSDHHQTTDAIFNLDFSPDGKCLLTANAKNMFSVYDSANRKLIQHRPEAHFSHCNGIRFISDKVFATYSDDMSVRIWDLRYLKERLKTLEGHEGWVKNVDVLPGSGNSIISSSFDESIRLYNLSEPHENIQGKEVFRIANLMRARLAPTTHSFLIISTSVKDIYKISSLDIEHLQEDYLSFCRRWKIGSQEAPPANVTMNNSPLHMKRNKLSFVHHFPAVGFEDMVTSIDIHPDEVCCIARHDRNRPEDSKVQWTSVYDLRDYPPKSQPLSSPLIDSRNRGELFNIKNMSSEDLGSSSSDDEYEEDFDDTIEPHMDARRHVENIEFAECVNSILLPRREWERLRQARSEYMNEVCALQTCFPKPLPEDLYDATFFSRESVNAEGYIKESVFSPTGRLIASPYESGFRLLAYNDNCDDFVECADPDYRDFTTPQLTKIKTILGHNDVVLCVKFHPFRPLIVSGCLGGRLCWHESRFDGC